MKNVRLKSLKSRIMLYTIIPAVIILTIAASVISIYTFRLVEGYSYSEMIGSTELVCSRIEDVFAEYGEIVSEKSSSENVRKFLQAVSDRDDMENSAYFSQAMGELDSTISGYSDYAEKAWLCSAKISGVALSNSSAGWTASGDFDISDYPEINITATQAEYLLTDPYISHITGEETVSVISAVEDPRNGEFLGVYGIDIDMDKLEKRISGLASVSRKENYIFIRSSNGKIIYSSSGGRVFRDFASLQLMQSQKRERTIYSFGELSLTGTRRALLHSEWTIYALHDINKTENMIQNYMLSIFIAFLAVGILLVITIAYASNKISKPIQAYTKLINELKFDGTDNAEGDILRPEGCMELAKLAIGFNSLYERNTEILSELREINIESEKKRLLYQTALESSSDVIFEYDIECDMLKTYGSLFDSSIPKTIEHLFDNFLETIKSGELYSTENFDETSGFFRAEGYESTTVSKVLEDGTVSWISFEGVPVFSENIPVRVVGKIRRIDDVRSLMENAQKDLFSGFYNKMTTEKLMEKRIAEGGRCAVLIVDIDNFKNINDLLGHDFGDDVIKDISDKIRKELGDNDIAGRVGGDEFLLLVKDDEAHSEAEALGKAVCKAVKHTYSNADGSVSVTVSASIGMAFAPDHGSSFDELYRCADIAMYISKNGGKDRYTLYNGQKRPEYKGR